MSRSRAEKTVPQGLKPCFPKMFLSELKLRLPVTNL